MDRYKFTGLIIFIFCNLLAFGQDNHHDELKLQLQLTPVRIVLYSGINNDFVLNSALPPERWEIKSSNGSIKRIDNNIKLIPETPGADTIYLFYISDKKEKIKAGYWVFSVLSLPTPNLTLGKENKITSQELIALELFEAKIPNFQYYFPFNIKKGVIKIFSQHKEIIELKITEGIIDEKDRIHLQNLKHGDVLLFTDLIGFNSKLNLTTKVNGGWVEIK